MFTWIGIDVSLNENYANTPVKQQTKVLSTGLAATLLIILRGIIFLASHATNCIYVINN